MGGERKHSKIQLPVLRIWKKLSTKSFHPSSGLLNLLYSKLMKDLFTLVDLINSEWRTLLFLPIILHQFSNWTSSIICRNIIKSRFNFVRNNFSIYSSSLEIYRTVCNNPKHSIVISVKFITSISYSVVTFIKDSMFAFSDFFVCKVG